MSDYECNHSPNLPIPGAAVATAVDINPGASLSPRWGARGTIAPRSQPATPIHGLVDGHQCVSITPPRVTPTA